MIVIVCSACDRRSLLPLSMVTGLTRWVALGGEVIHELNYTCWCGAPGVKVVQRVRPPR
ncbi:hypothetical protein ACFCV3_35360 [Kribbella sp. NPDC056345]|uniref:hypothetical protein n=1 Tax=Kribbella sp. NPDC056345 TaxID=3345789 RepID=UPI0035E05766